MIAHHQNHQIVLYNIKDDISLIFNKNIVMKKGNKNFKILTKTEANQVKGGLAIIMV
jgi:hypothetical protein